MVHDYIFTEFFFLLPTILGSNDILCSDDNLFVAINDSTAFCQIQGNCNLPVR